VCPAAELPVCHVTNKVLSSHWYMFGHYHRSGTVCCSGFRAGAALPGLKAHPLVPVRGTGAKASPLTPVGNTYQPVLKGPARAATLQDPLTPVGFFFWFTSSVLFIVFI